MCERDETKGRYLTFSFPLLTTYNDKCMSLILDSSSVWLKLNDIVIELPHLQVTMPPRHTIGLYANDQKKKKKKKDIFSNCHEW